jgi:two-component system chemotaxis response regulator CheY
MAVRVLIVDDNQVVRRLLGEMLRSHGWEVCAEAENGEQAVVKARELNPDLITLDLAMPVMNGIKATREISKILPSVPIVVYTLHYAEWIELEAKKAGARAVVAKSDVAKLVSVAEDLLREKSQVAAAGATEA